MHITVNWSQHLYFFFFFSREPQRDCFLSHGVCLVLFCLHGIKWISLPQMARDLLTSLSARHGGLEGSRNQFWCRYRWWQMHGALVWKGQGLTVYSQRTKDAQSIKMSILNQFPMWWLFFFVDFWEFVSMHFFFLRFSYRVKEYIQSREDELELKCIMRYVGCSMSMFFLHLLPWSCITEPRSCWGAHVHSYSLRLHLEIPQEKKACY